MTATDDCPRVSVIIPAFNAEGCIARALASVQSQSETDLEIIVIDDCSTDHTREVVEGLAANDERIVLLSTDKNGGPSVARNRGLTAATGEWVALLDADDAIAPDRLRIMCGYGDNLRLDAVGDDLAFFDVVANRKVAVGGYVPFKTVGIISLTQYLKTTTYKVGFAEAFLREEKPLSLLKLIFHRSFIKRAQLSYNEHYRYCEDFLFYFDALYAGARVGLVNQPLYLYTEPLGSMSGAASPFSRTSPNRGSIVDAVEYVLTTKAKLNRKQRRLLCDRRDGAVCSIDYDNFRARNVGRGKFARALSAIPEPRVWLRFAREMRHGWSARQRRRKAANSPAAQNAPR